MKKIFFIIFISFCLICSSNAAGYKVGNKVSDVFEPVRNFKIDMINSNYQVNMVINRDKLYNLLLKMNSCVLEKERLYLITVEQDSLLAVQDSIIATYEYKDGLVKPFYQQEWFRSIMYTLMGAVLQNELKESLNHNLDNKKIKRSLRFKK